MGPIAAEYEPNDNIAASTLTSAGEAWRLTFSTLLK